MKATGITRPVDQLGRIVLPRELRRQLGIKEDEDRLEIFVDGEDIILRKYKRGCTFCGGMDELREFGGQYICGGCRDKLRLALAESEVGV